MASSLTVALAPHPVADLVAFETRWPCPLGEVDSSRLDALLATPEPAIAPWSDEVKGHVRDLLRVGGFKPAGRNKPCNEYIRAVAARDAFPRINAAVDACNLAVLHGGLPISTVDLDRLDAPLTIAIALAGSKVVFNASGQLIDLSGLLCLHDSGGPVADAVKDAQRAKTSPQTTRTLSVIWGTRRLDGRTTAVRDWYVDQVEALGGEVASVPLISPSDA